MQVSIPALDEANAVEMLRQAALPKVLEPSDYLDISEKLGYNAVLLRLIGQCISDGQMSVESARSTKIGKVHDVIGGDTYADKKDVSVSSEGALVAS